MSELPAALAAWVTSVVEHGGYLGLAALTLLENLFPPIPSELVLPVAGYLVSQGRLSLVLAVAAGTAGSLTGALILYGLGYRWGERGVRRLIRRHGRWLGLGEADLDRSQEWFRKYGGYAVLLGRLVPSLRSLISIPAGMARMPLLPFVLYTTLGSTVWNAFLVGSGWLLGDQWDRLKPYLQVLGWGGLLAAGLGAVWLIWTRKRDLARQRQAH
jgi:membrane protein DedA with SNARE-associated domain